MDKEANKMLGGSIAPYSVTSSELNDDETRLEKLFTMLDGEEGEEGTQSSPFIPPLGLDLHGTTSSLLSSSSGKFVAMGKDGSNTMNGSDWMSSFHDELDDDFYLDEEGDLRGLSPVPPLPSSSSSSSSAAAAAAVAAAAAPSIVVAPPTFLSSVSLEKQSIYRKMNRKMAPVIKQFVADNNDELLEIFKLAKGGDAWLTPADPYGPSGRQSGTYIAYGTEVDGDAIYGISLFRVHFDSIILGDRMKDYRQFGNKNDAIRVANQVKLLFDSWYLSTGKTREDIYTDEAPTETREEKIRALIEKLSSTNLSIRDFIADEKSRLKGILLMPHVRENAGDILDLPGGELTPELKVRYNIPAGVQRVQNSRDVAFCIVIQSVRLSRENILPDSRRTNFKDPRDCGDAVIRIYELLEEWINGKNA